ncbi:MAG: ribbon-helix-helix protein, CopG family [Cyclobacteriaceae bacterium]|nr:ribbon-helix-helix protein, CopG family [Cyclobacteriaceae bacterium]
MLNVRLDKEMERKLNSYSQQKNLSKTAIVKEALEAYLTKTQRNESPYEVGKDLFGSDGSGNAKASTTYKSKLKDKLREKHSH